MPGSGSIPTAGTLDTCARVGLTVSFVAFVRRYLHAGRAWLAWSIYGLRTLVLILNFSFPVSINFRAITGLRQFSLGGEMVSVPIGIPNPWGLLVS